MSAVGSLAETAGGVPGAGRGEPAGPQVGRDRRRVVPYLLLLPGLAWLVVFFAVPLVSLFTTSLQTRVPGTLESFQQSYRFANYSDALREYWPQFLRSFWYAGVATLVALAVSYPLAYCIAFKAGRWRNVLLVLVIAPFFTSFILRTVAWRQILGEEGPVLGVLRGIGVFGPGDRLLTTSFAVIAGITYNFLPFMTLPLYASLERIDPRLLEAAGDLYANGLTTFRKVTLPLSMPGVVAGTLLTFIPATGDYVNAALLGNSRTAMVGNVIESRFLRVVDYPTASVLSLTLMATILVIVTVYIRRAGTEELV
jgi:spermidine/putrescine transport system permease protein